VNDVSDVIDTFAILSMFALRIGLPIALALAVGYWMEKKLALRERAGQPVRPSRVLRQDHPNSLLGHQKMCERDAHAMRGVPTSRSPLLARAPGFRRKSASRMLRLCVLQTRKNSGVRKAIIQNPV